jgi:RNA polymerase sigma-70 factor (ECF subfamily)
LVGQAEELIERISHGDREALIDLFEQNRFALLSYIRAMTPDHGLAEEILQDTLYAVWTCAGKFEGASSGRTWIFGIARRRARDQLRKRALPLIGLQALETLPSRDPEPDDQVFANEGSNRLASLIGELSPAHREALILTFVQEFSYRETADVLGVPIGTVKSRLFGAKRELRELLERSGRPTRPENTEETRP